MMRKAINPSRFRFVSCLFGRSTHTVSNPVISNSRFFRIQTNQNEKQNLLPIIIIFERHWDITPKKVTKKLMPLLAAEGYDTFCFESPNDLSNDARMAAVYETVEYNEYLYLEASKFLKKFHIKLDEELSEVSYSQLQELMRLYVSSKNYVEVAERIKNYPASLILKEIIENSKKLSMGIEGLDINSQEFNKITLTPLTSRSSELNVYKDKRDEVISNNLLSLYKKRAGIVSICGADHASALISFFIKNNIEDQIIYYFPYSGLRFDISVDDIDILIKRNEVLKDRSLLLSNDNDIESFSNKIISEVKEKSSNSTTPSTRINC